MSAFPLRTASTPSIAQLVERWTVVGRTSDIHRSLVQIRLEGFLALTFPGWLCQEFSLPGTGLSPLARWPSCWGGGDEWANFTPAINSSSIV